MACHLQDTRGWRDFAGLMAVKGGSHYDFVRSQTDVVHQYIDVVDQIEKEALLYQVSPSRLAEWERRLDCPLWHLVVADRSIGHMFVKGGLIPRTDIMDLATHENIARFVCYYLDFLERRLEVFRPDVVFFTVLAAMPALALAKVCQWMRIPFFVLRHTRILDRYVITLNDSTEEFASVEERFQGLLRQQTNIPPLPEEARRYFDSFRGAKPELPSYTLINTGKRQQARQESWLRFWGRIGRRFMGSLYRGVRRIQQPDRHLRSGHPFSSWWLASRAELAIRYQSRRHTEPPQIGQEPYVLFPLHLDPEASTMILAPNFVNQLVVVEALAKNIPLTHKLYVKEHPTMLGRRPRGFYEEIGQYPNVRLIQAGEDNSRLIRHADLVTVITGTSGWEAILMERPVITFGDCFYADLGFSERCSDFNQLGQQIRHLLFERDELGQEMHVRRLLLFLTAVFEESFPLSEHILWPQRPLRPDQLGELELNTARTIADQLATAISNFNAGQQNTVGGREGNRVEDVLL
jgi:hypothetical protein